MLGFLSVTGDNYHLFLEILATVYVYSVDQTATRKNNNHELINPNSIIGFHSLYNLRIIGTAIFTIIEYMIIWAPKNLQLSVQECGVSHQLVGKI